jgi:TRAP-type C4-dicarboxylate transport system permease small subunit
LLRAEAFGRWVENALLVALFAGLMVLAVTQIFLRNVMSLGLPWADGMIRIAVLWLAVLGAVAASRDRKHIAINLSQRVLPANWQRPILIVVEAFTAAVCGWLAWYSWVFVRDSRAFGDLLFGDWPAWMFQVILPVGFALIAYRYAMRMLGRLAGLDP